MKFLKKNIQSYDFLIGKLKSLDHFGSKFFTVGSSFFRLKIFLTHMFLNAVVNFTHWEFVVLFNWVFGPAVTGTFCTIEMFVLFHFLYYSRKEKVVWVHLFMSILNFVVMLLLIAVESNV